MLQVDLSKTHGVTNEASEETKRASKSRHEVEQVEPSSSACGWAARVRFNLYEDKGLCESLAVLFWFTKNCIYPSPCAGQCAIFETNFQEIVVIKQPIQNPFLSIFFTFISIETSNSRRRLPQPLLPKPPSLCERTPSSLLFRVLWYDPCRPWKH